MYTPGEKVSIDQNMIGTKARLIFTIHAQEAYKMGSEGVGLVRSQDQLHLDSMSTLGREKHRKRG